MNIISTVFVSFLFLSFLLLSLPTPSHSTKCNKQDKKALKKIEKALTIPPHFQYWKSDTGCCQWSGIECDPHTHRVTSLNIQDFTVVSGKIPDAVGDLPSLKRLTIQFCPNLTGPLPQSLTKLTNLTLLELASNSLSGPVPSFLGQLKNLESIDLSYNTFSGPIPSSLFELPRLVALRLYSNKLTGSIPESVVNLSLPSYIYIGNNQLTGKVPRSFGNGNFTVLDFAWNNLDGDISFLFGKNKSLNTADFSNNQFEFDMSKVEFPEKLESLELSRNKIHGSIPFQMTRLKLARLDLSYNMLCGKIPTGGLLQKYEQTVYLHNRCLCGAPLAACK